MGYEYKVVVGGVEYGMEDIAIDSAVLTQPLFDKPSVGNACAAEFSMSFWPSEEPPRMAEIRPYVRKSPDAEWELLGIFWLDERSQDGDLLTVKAYDAMLKADVDWTPTDDMEFPMTMENAAEIIAATMGTTLDPRCSFKQEYTIDYPVGYAMRDVLGYIAIANVGNWIVTAEGKLLLVPLFGSAPPETNYLVEESGDPILFGDTRILT